jgi:Flp pilus assembly pilin Flp
MRTFVDVAAGAIEFACLTGFITVLIVGFGLAIGQF